ncbi:MAG TPA: hypothetical protein VES02_06185 [Dermatophilaceae bacterium]|nr:hypothetical protein [Dermatophilaceae bacterium]
MKHLYDLALHDRSRIPSDLTYEIGDNDVRRVVQRFHGDGGDGTIFETRYPTSPCRCSLTSIFSGVKTGSERVDYVSDNGSTWQQQLLRPGLTIRDAPHAYAVGTGATTDWLGAPLSPGLVFANDVPITDIRYPALAQNSSFSFRIPSITDSAGHGGNAGFTQGRLYRDGQLVKNIDGYATVPSGATPATWRMEIDHSHFVKAWASATAGQVAWIFTGGGSSSSQPTPLPMIDAQIEVPVGLSGRPRSSLRTFTVRPWRLDGATTDRVAVTMAFSTDGG